ncbi:MAG: DUF1275 domain-containing protein [Lactobacillales bacterium]|jgi:uncharacterized membrane protein YoaK (UPF0700 family)|nr:DUF1275 domain-containing protein [Lactobacillales bacterium]
MKLNGGVILKTPPKERQFFVYEDLEVGMLLTAISGYLDSYTYITHGERFASLQSGNLILLGANLANGSWKKAVVYLLPILFFMLGAGFNFVIKKYAKRQQMNWRKLSVSVEFLGMTTCGILSFFIPNNLSLALLAFFAAIQADTFGKLRGMPYATIMSTGNLKTAGSMLIGGLIDHDKESLEKGKNAACVVFSFFLGALISALLVKVLGSFTIFGVTLMLLIVLYMMFKDRTEVES